LRKLATYKLESIFMKIYVTYTHRHVVGYLLLNKNKDRLLYYININMEGSNFHASIKKNVYFHFILK
jgi:hypothetical protein